MTPAEHNQAQQPILKAYLDNELPLWRRLAVRMHLTRCAACREEMQAMQQIGNELRGQTIDPLDPGLRSRILATVREITPEPARPVPSRRPILIWSGAAFAALLLIAVFASRPQFAPSLSKSDFYKSTPPMASNPSAAAPATLSNLPPSSSAAAKRADKTDVGAPPPLGATVSGAPGSSQEATASKPMDLQSNSPQPPATQEKASPGPAVAIPPLPQSAVAGAARAKSSIAEDRTAGETKKIISPATPPNEMSSVSSGFGGRSSAYHRDGGGSFGKLPKRATEAAVDSPRLPVAHGNSVAMARKAKAPEPVVLERAGFDLNGYQFVALDGQRIAVPFQKSLNAVRFARATDGKMTLVKAASPPILYLAPADMLVNDAVPGARWQPLPPGSSAAQPLYVRPAPDWEQFTTMRWYPNMTIVGGFAYDGSADASFSWLSGSHVQIGATLYPDLAAYRAFADAHPDALRLHVVYDNATPSPAAPEAARSRGSAGSPGSGAGRTHH